MLVEKNGDINKEITSVLLSNNKMISLSRDQFFQWSETGKTLELWDGKKAFLNKKEFGYQRVKYWLAKSVIAFY
jgi:hypothetical protein